MAWKNRNTIVRTLVNWTQRVLVDWQERILVQEQWVSSSWTTRTAL
jgi:hypothetical protein